jgi:formylglycine-generating enzyme required for sulfatase activity
MLLHDHRALRLAFVNACEGAKDGQQEAFVGVAQKLIQQGVPAVVAMQSAVTDPAALDLAQEFYEAVGDGYPIDIALTAARQRLKSNGNEFEWATPVLLGCADDFALFDLPAPPRPLRLKPFEPETVLVREGTFLMGCDPAPGIPEYETPQFSLYQPSYRIGKYPVTNEQYAAFLHRKSGIEAPPGWYGYDPPPGEEAHPVAGVSWYDALEYCRWLNEVTETGGTYLLPSEAQWEKAARGTKGRVYPWGDHWDAEEPQCNLNDRRTTPVDAFSEGVSPYGCFDMVGNVREWTRTLWGTDRLQPDDAFRYPWREDEHNDDDGVISAQVRRTYRGRGEPWVPCPLRASMRGSQLPRDPGSRGARLGFRVVLIGVHS